jgi:catalase
MTAQSNGRDRTDAKQEQLDQLRVGNDGAVLTTDHGLAVEDTDNSLKPGERGPSLIEDFHLREKITRFDHERIPERVVHARGFAAHGYFEVTDALADVTAAHFLAESGRRTPVFTRFSTVGGSRGSADTVRDVRGFATKFYTQQGNFDIVGNNMPVFFIQDAIKFPDFVHAVKPEPHHEIPQASSAHDSFWDFVSLQPESTHMLMWLMSDRALPRSYRMMQGFGVHTFRLVDAEGRGTLVKWHWRPVLGTHSLDWDETQKIAGKDPDFNRRDLFEAIEAGHTTGEYPTWELAVQLIEESKEMSFDYDLLDATKIVPEEDVPLRVVGRMVLDRNVQDYFTETEQVAFHLGNLVPGIDVTNDPLLQGRLFSYLDTQLTRLGGPNFAHLPTNRPIVEPHNHQRDGFGQQRIQTSRANYHPNSISAGCPAIGTVEQGAYRHYAEKVDGRKIQRRSASFADHYSQATLFWNSMSAVEKQHITNAFSFELGKLERPEIVERMLGNLTRVDGTLAEGVATKLGLELPETPVKNHGKSSPALSQANQPGSAATRRIAVLAADGVDAASLDVALAPAREAGAVVEVLAPHGGRITASDGETLPVDRMIVTMSSVLYDAVFVADGKASVQALADTGEAVHYVAEAYRHGKPVAALGDGVDLLALAPIDGSYGANGTDGADRSVAGLVEEQGLVTCRLDPGQDGGEQVLAFGTAFVDAVSKHRFWDRRVSRIPA